MGTPENQAIFGKTHDGSYYELPMNGDDYVSIIREEHMRTHRGQAFVCSDVVSLTSTETVDFIMYNSSLNNCHLRHWEVTADGSPVTFTLYEVTSLGTLQNTGSIAPCTNANRKSSNVSSVGMFVQSSVSVVSSIQLEHSRTTGNKQAGGSKGALTTEWVLKDDTWYHFRLKNESGGATITDYYFFWYEPNDD